MHAGRRLLQRGDRELRERDLPDEHDEVARSAAGRAARAEIRLRGAVDLALTVGALAHGTRDPTYARAGTHGEQAWRAVRTPDGPATLCFVLRGARDGTSGHRPARSTRVDARAWGPGADWALARAPDMVGARDAGHAEFAPAGPLRDLARRVPGLRITRTARVFDELAATILEQKVTGFEAHASYARVVRAWGAPAPRPPGAPRLFVPPAPEVLARRVYWEWHAHDVERRRAETVRACASRARRVEETAEMRPGDARRRLEALPGVGRWTAAKVALYALGDADAVPVGDYNLPNLVSFFFTGEPRGDDARMLELLAPYAGHRGRVLRILLACGVGAPRFGPRRPLRRLFAL